MASQKDKFTYSIAKNERTFWGSFVFWLAIGLVLAGVDQLTKSLAFRTGFGSWLDRLAPVISKVPFKNSNFAFSLPVPVVAMYVIYGLLLAVIFWHLVKKFLRMDGYSQLAWVLILSGALSNVTERIALGYVRDFVYIYEGIFNIADFYIILGILILTIQQVKTNLIKRDE